MKDRWKQDARTTIERRQEARRQSNDHAKIGDDDHAPGVPGSLPYEIGFPVFTCELRKVRWPSTKTFKHDLTDKYDGKISPFEFLSIYIITVQAIGGRDEKLFANYFPLALKPNVRS